MLKLLKSVQRLNNLMRENFTLEEATKAQWGRHIALLFL
jgi:hypothetical protein